MALEITASPLEWATNDEENWANFLASPTGTRLIPKLMELCPPLLASGGVNEILIRSGEVRGFQLVARAIFDLTQATPKAPPDTTNYPPPENDAAWKDGQKLEKEEPRKVLGPTFE